MGEAGSRKLAAGRREQLQQMADANTATTGGTQPVATEDAEADGEEGGGAADVSVRPSTSYGELLYRSTSDLSVARLGTANTLSSTGMVRVPSLPWHTPCPPHRPC